MKSLLSDCQGIPKAQQRFVLDNRVLTDEETLLGIGLPAELWLVHVQWKTDEETFVAGDLVQVHYDGNVVFDTLGGYPRWLDPMDEMLGRTFKVAESGTTPEAGFVWLPSPVV